MSSCSPTLRKSFSNVSSPEKAWVFFHPFKAKKAFLISKEAEKIKDSIGKAEIIGNDNNGGHLDAFKHSFWMARLSQGIGKGASLSLGKAHEKGNYKTFKKHKLEDGFLPDKPSSDMDLFNNMIGVEIGKKNKKASKKELIQHLLESLENGELRILSKDSLGIFLDCKKKRIPLDSLKHKWNTKKCLAPSDTKTSLRRKDD
jgi:hypothetical protein